MNVQKSIEKLIRGLYLLDSSSRMPYVIFVQELPLNITADKWNFIKTLLPKYGLHVNQEATMMTCIHPFWNHYHSNPEAGLTRTQCITLHFPPVHGAKQGIDLSLVNVYGSRDAKERPQIQRELSTPRKLCVYSGDFNSTFLLSQSTTVTADALVWPFLELKTGKIESPSDPEWIDCWSYCRPQDQGFTRFKGTWKGHTSQSRIDFIFLSAPLIPILHPEKCYLVDFGSDHLALTVEFSSTQLPKAPKPHGSMGGKSEPKPFRYSAIQKEALVALYEIVPPCSIADFNALLPNQQDTMIQNFMDSMHLLIQPKLRPSTKTRSHHAYSRAFKRAKDKATPAGRLPTLLKKWSQTPLDIDCLEDKETHTFLTDESLASFANEKLRFFGHQEPAKDPSVIDAQWPSAGPEEIHCHSHHTDSEFTFEEFLEIINTSDKAPVCGPMRIPTRALSHCNMETLHFLHNAILQLVSNQSSLMLNTEILLIHKKGSPFSIGNYRPISLTSVLYRIYSTWLKSRLEVHLEQVLHPSQFGFRCQRQIHIQVLRLLNASAACEDPHVILFDIAKAFDSVDLSLLWHQLAKYGTPVWLIKALKNLYIPATFRVHLASGLSAATLQNILKGLRQGCPLSALLFLLYIDPLLRKLSEHTINLHPCDARPCSATTPLSTHGGFADDVAVVTDPSHVEQVLQIFAEFCRDFGLLYHPEKTEIMSLATPPVRASVHPEVVPNSWTVSTRDGTPHHFRCLPSSTPPIKYLGVYLHHSQEAIETAIRRDLSTDLAHYRSFALSSYQRLCIINQILIPRIVYKLVPYPLLVDVSYIEKELLNFLRQGGPDADDLMSLSKNIAFLTRPLLGAHLTCVHKLTTGRFLPLIQGILRNDPNTPPDLHQALSSRFNEYHVRTSRLPMLDPVVSSSLLHHSLHISSSLNPQPTLENFGFLEPIPDSIMPYQNHPNVFTTLCLPIPTLSGRCWQSLKDNHCHDALAAATEWLAINPPVQCIVVASSYSPPTPSETSRLYKRQQCSLKQRTAHAGWSSLDCKTGTAYLGRTTGHVSASRGIWQALLFTLSEAKRNEPLLIFTNSYHATCLQEYTTDRGRKKSAKCKHRDLIWKALKALALRQSSTRIIWVKSQAKIIPHVMATTLARTAMSLPLIPPKPSYQYPAIWIRNGITLELPAASPLLDITEQHHPPDLTVLHLKHVNLHLSALNLLSNPSPKLVIHMHGRVNWANFAWWYEYQTPRLCCFCGESTHATDVMTSLSQCKRLREIAATALCAGYKKLGPSISDWLLTSNPEERRNFTRDLVPDSLTDHLHERKQMPDFLKARREYKYLAIMHNIHDQVDKLFQRIPPEPDPPS